MQGGFHVLEDGAVDRVQADGAETFAGYGGDVGTDGAGGEAGQAVGVGRVGYGPLGGGGADWKVGFVWW